MTQGRDIVLIVADDQEVRESLKFALEFDGFLVHVCGSGNELFAHPALPWARCLVLDYEMPLMNGIEVVWYLTARKIAIPAIIMTSRATDKLRRQAVLAGVQYVLEKPFLDDVLVDRIREILFQPP